MNENDMGWITEYEKLLKYRLKSSKRANDLATRIILLTVLTACAASWLCVIGSFIGFHEKPLLSSLFVVSFIASFLMAITQYRKFRAQVFLSSISLSGWKTQVEGE